jgi:hypothetical protein
MGNPTTAINCETIYLCQVSPHVSCGACCGLYNVSDPSRRNLEAMLIRRTRWFAEVPRTMAGIDAFRTSVEGTEHQERPFPDFHHCAFLGVIEDDGRRVGCLLHPLAKGNEGIDWRGLSYYGGMACRTYFCPSARQLPSRWLIAVRQSMNHWYLHGLVVTERRLLAALFTELEKRLGRVINTADFSEPVPAAALLTTLTTLKMNWPFRRQGAPGVSNYFFEDGLYARPAVKRKTKTLPASRFEDIFQELDSGFSSADDIEDAEAKIEGLLIALEMTLAIK